MMTESTGIERSAATGVARREANQLRTSRRSMSAIGRPEKRGRDLLAQIAPVHLERSHLPSPLVAPEHGLGDGLEEGFVGVTRRILSPPDRGQHLAGARPRLGDTHGAGIPDNLPDALAAMLAVDEEAFAAGRQDADAEAGELAVAGVVCGLAGLERFDAGVGEGDSGHACSPGCGCSRGTGGCRFRSPVAECRRNNDPVSMA